jgi:hypothetical protein
MFWIALEALIALVVLLAVVWWTMCTRRPDAPGAPPPAPHDDLPPEGR